MKETTQPTPYLFYDKMEELFEPFVPMIVNDLTTGMQEVVDEILESVELDSEDEEVEVYLSFSFSRGVLPDSAEDSAEICDYEMVVKPFFTTKPYVLIGLHNFRTKAFDAKVLELKEFEALAILECFADMVTTVFPTETLENKKEIMRNWSELALEEYQFFDEPLEMYQDLTNEHTQQYLIKKRHMTF